VIFFRSDNGKGPLSLQNDYMNKLCYIVLLISTTSILQLEVMLLVFFLLGFLCLLSQTANVVILIVKQPTQVAPLRNVSRKEISECNKPVRKYYVFRRGFRLGLYFLEMTVKKK